MNTFILTLKALLALGAFGNVRTSSVPFGSDRPALGNIKVAENLSAKDFYARYVAASKPVLLRGSMLNTIPVERWSDAYLTSRHGKSSVNVDMTKFESRESPSVEASLAEFVSWYQEREAYLISTLPDSLQREFPLPACLNCGGLRERMQDFVMWFSAGGSSSTLHFDNVENLYCQVDGTKQWIFVDPVNGSRFIPLDHPEGHYCGVNVSAVDYERYPTLREVPFWRADLNAGDCLYVPLNWWHQVNSLAGRNLAVNIWWAPIHPAMRGLSAFDDAAPGDPVTLSDLTFNPGEWIRHGLVALAEEHQGSLDYDTLHRLVVHEHTGERLVSRDSFDTLDRNGDGVVDTLELSSVNAATIHKAVNNVMVGAMNTNGKSQAKEEELNESAANDDHGEL